MPCEITRLPDIACRIASLDDNTLMKCYFNPSHSYLGFTFHRKPPVRVTQHFSIIYVAWLPRFPAASPSRRKHTRGRAASHSIILNAGIIFYDLRWYAYVCRRWSKLLILVHLGKPDEENSIRGVYYNALNSAYHINIYYHISKRQLLEGRALTSKFVNVAIKIAILLL